MSEDKEKVEPEEEHPYIPFESIRRLLWDFGKCWHFWGEWSIDRHGDIVTEKAKDAIGRYEDQVRQCQVCKFRQLTRKKIFT